MFVRTNLAIWSSITAVCVLLTCSRAEGVVLLRSSMRTIHEPRSCWLAGSGWQWQGEWGDFLGTAIAPNYFITAKHVGGGIGDTFHYEGRDFQVVAAYSSAQSDLRIFQVDGSFANWAPLYTGRDEIGRMAMLFGRGRPAGGPVVVDGQTKGWFLGPPDRVRTWGDNTISDIFRAGNGLGDLLSFTFGDGGDIYEAHLAPGDSGGGLFILDGDVWKLAGIHYAIDGPYSLTGQDGTGFFAAIYDQGGLYIGGDGRWRLVPDTVEAIPGSSYSTRISTNLSWIESVIGPQVQVVPEPATLGLLCIGLTARRRQLHARLRRLY